jgi:hypothetical protein
MIEVHATLFGVAPEIYEEFTSEFEGLDEVEYDGRVLRFWHDCVIFDAEGLFERLAGRLGSEAHGGLDVIDREEWTITRYVLENGAVTSITIPLNEVLDAKANEWGA